MLAIHQAFAAESITIAFPQTVVWSGAAKPGELYEGQVGVVNMSRPGVDEPEVDPERRVAHWRLPGLRRSDQQSGS